MSIAEQVAADVDTVFLGADGFEETVTYTPVSGTASSISAIVQDLIESTTKAVGGMDMEQIPGASATAMVSISATDIASPAYSDVITTAAGRNWNVKEKSRQEGMWVLYCTADERMSL
jgi:hypothetical protein